MSGLIKEIQPAVKKETQRMVVITAVGVTLMWIIFAVLHFIVPGTVPFGYTVILGGDWRWPCRRPEFFLDGADGTESCCCHR